MAKTKNPNLLKGILCILAGFVISFVFMLGIFTISELSWNSAAKKVIGNDKAYGSFYEESTKEGKIERAYLKERNERKEKGKERLTTKVDFKDGKIKYSGTGPTWIRFYAFKRALLSTALWFILYIIPVAGGTILGIILIVNGKKKAVQMNV